MSRPVLAMLAAVAAVAAAGCGKSSSTTSNSASKTAASTTGTTSAGGSAGACQPAKPTKKGAQHIAKPKTLLPANKPATLVMQTNCGEIDIALDVKRARMTASSVAYLVRKGFYDGLSFHRIAKLPTGGDFVIQGGDPTGSSTGGPGYKTVDKPPADAKYTKGVVAMAKTQQEKPGTAGSQFYVVTGADAGLPPDYAVIGKVTAGLGVVERIGKLGDASEQPTQTVVIKDVKVGSS